jgi:hypothetical protein
MSDSFMPELTKIVEQAQQLGYVTGRNEMRKSIAHVIGSYADLSTTELMTASDAFRLILAALVEDESPKPTKEYE